MGEEIRGYVIRCDFGDFGYYGGCDSYCRFYDDPGKAEVFPGKAEAEAVAREVLPLGEYFIFEVTIANSY